MPGSTDPPPRSAKTLDPQFPFRRNSGCSPPAPAGGIAVNVLSTPAPLAASDTRLPGDGRTISRLIDAYVVVSVLAVVVAEVVGGHLASAARTHAIFVLVSALLTR